MIPNRLQQLWRDGKPTINGWLSIGNSFTAEIMAAQGYDSLTIDVQHGALDYSAALPMLQAMRASGIVPMVRVPWLEPGIIMKMLDAGAYGIICPMINTAAQAAEFVSYVRYPPIGQRSFGPTRATYSMGSNIPQEANTEVLAFAMIETTDAMANLESIAATPGLDGLYIGPADLTFSLHGGKLAPGFDREEADMIDVIRRIATVCKSAGIRAALHCGTPDYAARAIGWGFDLVTVSGDSRLLAAAAEASVRRFRDLMREEGNLMPHVLVAGKLHPSGLKVLETTANVTWDYVEEISEASYAPFIAKADGLVIRTQPLSAATVAKAERLKIVSRHGVGHDSVDLNALTAKGIALAVVGDVNSISVAEHAMMLLLATSKRVFDADRATRSGDWRWRDNLFPVELWGKRLLILGFGRSGRHLAKIAAGFGMSVAAYDPYLKSEPDLPVQRVSNLVEGLQSADFVSIHIPRTDQYIIGAKEVAAMKRGAILVNAARGGIVDERALSAAIASGQLRGAGFDVFETEPPSLDCALLRTDGVVATPHIAGLTAESAERMAVQSVRNVLDFFTGQIDPALVINGVKFRDR